MNWFWKIKLKEVAVDYFKIVKVKLPEGILWLEQNFFNLIEEQGEKESNRDLFYWDRLSASVLLCLNRRHSDAGQIVNFAVRSAILCRFAVHRYRNCTVN